MANPTAYTPGYDFGDFQAQYPTAPLPADELDNQFDQVSVATQAIVDALADVRRSDGALKNGIVTRDALSPEMLVGLNPPSVWSTSVGYVNASTVLYVQSGVSLGFYRCEESHTSGVFATDLAAGKWSLLFDVQLLNGQDGATILSGAGAPDNGEGNNGDVYIDNTNVLLYRKVAGAWGSGVPLRGSKIFTGSSNPDNSVGATGDMYFQNAAKTLHFREADPVGPNGSYWTSGILLIGPLMLTGSGAPDNGLGKTGDVYFDSTGRNMHIKSGATWGSAISLAGASGLDGKTIRATSVALADAVGADGDLEYHTENKTIRVKSGGAWGTAVSLVGPVSGYQWKFLGANTGASASPGSPYFTVNHATNMGSVTRIDVSVTAQVGANSSNFLQGIAESGVKYRLTLTNAADNGYFVIYDIQSATWTNGSHAALTVTNVGGALSGLPALGTDLVFEVTPHGAAGASGVPVGTPIPWPTEICPDWALVEDGAAYSRTTYADLFAVIGTRYGAGDGSTTFNVRDMRGEFLRGFANGSTNDPDRASRTDRGDGTTGDNVGTKQGHQIQSHAHNGAGANGTSNGNQGTGGSFARGMGSQQTDAAGGNETRPRNVSVMWIIKY